MSSNDVLVFMEQRGDKLHAAAAQLITPALALALSFGGKVVACLIGSNVDLAAAAASKLGVSQVLTVCDPSLEHYSALRYRTALSAAIDAARPRVALLLATFLGRDLAPRVAVRAKAALATDVISIEAADGGVRVRRPVYNGKAFATLMLPAGRLAIASVRANTFPAATPGAANALTTAVAFTAAPGDDRLTTKQVAKTGGGEKDVSEADIIVSGGRSLKSSDNFRMLYDLAHVLDGAVGASRAACDAGYQPHSRQVGLTGKTVTPKLYIACGISGAIQHLAGMRGSKVIVAINSDKEAPIFKVADYGVVGDLFKVVPALTESVKRLHAS